MITIEFYESYTTPQGIVYRNCWILSENGKPQLKANFLSELERFI